MIIKDFLTESEIVRAQDLYDSAKFEDGSATAGGLAAAVKTTRQIARDSGALPDLHKIFMGAFMRNPMVRRFCPTKVDHPTYYEYSAGSSYGWHVDAVMRCKNTLRADLSITVFVSDPEEYDGGVLEVSDSFVKLRAGAAVIYETTRVHQVTPVTLGKRRVMASWFQSAFRDPRIRDSVGTLREVVERLKAAKMDVEAREVLNVQLNLERQFIEL